MVEKGIDWFCGCHLVGFVLMDVGQMAGDFYLVLMTNLTQHDSHGTDDYTKTIDYHHLDMS
jgi:hypothetical protein